MIGFGDVAWSICCLGTYKKTLGLHGLYMDCGQSGMSTRSCTRGLYPLSCAGVFLSHQGLLILVYIALKKSNPNLGSRIPGCNSVRIASRMIKRLIDLEVG